MGGIEITTSVQPEEAADMVHMHVDAEDLHVRSALASSLWTLVYPQIPVLGSVRQRLAGTTVWHCVAYESPLSNV